jgi:hypothetical protein
MNHLRYRVIPTFLFLAFAFLVYSPMNAKAAVMFSADFEGQNFNGLNTAALCCAHSAVITNSVVAAGSYATKFTLNSDDKGYIFGTYTNPALRAELRKYDLGPKYGIERWYGASMYVAPSWQDKTYDPNGTIVMQWHGNGDPGEVAHSPQLSIAITPDNRWRVTTCYDATAISTSSACPNKIVRNIGVVTKGVWVDWVVHARWAYDSKGLLEVWKDGIKVVNYSGPNTYNDQTQNGLFFGIYKGWWKHEQPSTRDTLIIYHDNLKIGDQNSSYAEVAPKRPQVGPLPAPTNLRIGN